MKTTDLLNQFKTQTRSIISTVESKFSTLPDDQLNFKPEAKRWSILECFEHLNLYNQYYLSSAEWAADKATSASVQEMKYTWIGKKSIAMMHPTNVKKQKTFKHMIPAKSHLTRDVLATFLNDQQRILRLIERATLVNVTKSAVPVEFFKLLKMNIAETIEFILVHEERHLHQAERASKQKSLSRPILAI
jgi:hypothetical protein